MAGKKQEKQHAPAVRDPRFSRAQNDPRFLRPKKEAFQVVLDDRFKDLLRTEGSGGSGAGKRKVDKYGRKIGADGGPSGSEAQQLRNLYRIEGDDQDEEDDDDDNDEDEDDDGEEEDDDDEEEQSGTSALDYARGEAELLSSSDDDSSDEDEDEDADLPSEDDYSSVDEDELRATTAQQPASAAAPGASASSKGKGKAAAAKEELRGERTRRLAVVNMDWDHIRARDLYMVFSSLVSPTATRLPASANGAASSSAATAANGKRAAASAGLQVQGKVLSVRVYPSEFGRERMKKEDIEGPPRDIFKSADDQQASSSSSRKKKKGKKGKKRSGDEDDDDDEEEEITAKSIVQVDEGGDFDEEALRKYQLERLRYYYAVAEFDSVDAASHVYNEIDGTEMERSANVFDLRFVPDEMDFPTYALDADQPDREDGWRDELTFDAIQDGPAAAAASGAGSKYRPLDFKTDALRHSRVKLTWDADDPERTRITKNIFAPANAKKGKNNKNKKSGVMTLDEMRDEDFKAYLASATEDEDEDEEGGGEGTEAGRARLRALLNLDGPAQGEGAGNSDDEGAQKSKAPNKLKAALLASNSTASVWGRSRIPNEKTGLVEGEMEITFTPGLSEAKGRKELLAKGNKKGGKNGAGEDEEGEGEETTLDKYVRKQREKKERRKTERERAAGKAGADREQDGEGNGDGADLGFDDPFFTNDDDAERAMAAALEAHDGGASDAAISRRAHSAERKAQGAVEDGEGVQKKSKTMSKREAKLERKRKRKAKAAGEEYVPARGRDIENDSGDDEARDGADAGGAGFDVDVADPRFSAVLEDHRFALDPSHKAWKETKGMRKLVQERQRKRARV
ncbi:pre-rRNA-processing protein esf1 [Tilletia horrida]|nr:pre-rRNA-processing protein esf1 [Tilletia horrida]KAK0556711.1 pre-rRNA-processing protein esf1 [Tilletia horrida]